MSRKPIIAGNWKMNLLQSDAKALYEGIKSFVDKFSATQLPTVVIAPVFTSLNQVAEIPCDCGCNGSKLYVAGQNCHWEKSGAFTGEISVEMLKDAGCSFVIIGHSERRQYFGEDDECINRKVRKAIEYGLTPIICCGETIQQREEGITLDFINKQIDAAFLQVSAKDAMKCVIAYEPIWAIGTGRVATSAQAQEVCEAIRLDIRKLYGEEAASSIRILYGGSVNAGNAAELFRQPDIDGGLVGGASLKPDFCEIVNYNI